MRQQPERQVQKAVKELFERVGGKVWVLGTVRGKEDGHKGTRQTPGLGDLVVMLPKAIHMLNGASYRQMLWFECKAPKGRQSPAQKSFQVACEMADVPYLIGGIDVAIAFLKEGGWLK